MLFNSTVFLFAFLPITVAGFWLIGRGRLDRPARVWLVIASLFFYGWWDPRYLALIAGSIALNFTVGTAIRRNPARRRLLLGLGVTADLGVLAYFKYLDFLIGTANAVTGTALPLQHIALPLGISFFTFEQIAFLVDTYRDGGGAHRPLDFSLFVLFFPRLVAGPILRPHEIFPQLEQSGTRGSAIDTTVGLTVFVIGLAKKVLIADVLAPSANAVFDAAAHGIPVQMLEAWGGALAYTARLYFDFSGYSDMAIGLALLFGLRLPLNFNSPYKATSIIDFWRRWHMTLSRFLRDYLYIPLGGNRRGRVRRYVNLFITMLLGGLWHGASWTFVLWGALHGVYLLMNHAWPRIFGRVTTFAAVVVGWVFFRAPTVAAASTMLAGMAGVNGVAIPERLALVLRPILPRWVQGGGLGTFGTAPAALMLAATLAIAWFAPNTAQLVARWRPVIEQVEPARISWQPTATAGALVGFVLFFALLALFRLPPSEFLYYRF
jgi:D-alanyl-lipoteichoic acid acyltransferase DltB (MBOAT superfamily)